MESSLLRGDLLMTTRHACKDGQTDRQYLKGRMRGETDRQREREREREREKGLALNYRLQSPTLNIQGGTWCAVKGCSLKRKPCHECWEMSESRLLISLSS
jgi:hypothetical protein